MEQLTERQKEVLHFIEDRLSSRGRPPTLREIGSRFGVSLGAAQKHVKALVKKGRITSDPGTARGIDLAARKAMVPVPLVGRVAAGLPVTAEENFEDYLYIDRAVADNGKFFALKVKGDSMTGSGILEGDVVVVRKQETAENGDIVVALVEGEGAVKRLRRDGQTMFLESTNPAYGPIRSKEIAVVGKVVYLARTI